MFSGPVFLHISPPFVHIWDSLGTHLCCGSRVFCDLLETNVYFTVGDIIAIDTMIKAYFHVFADLKDHHKRLLTHAFLFHKMVYCTCGE